MMWFNDHSASPNIRSVMRLVLDFRSRNQVFQVLTPWVCYVNFFYFFYFYIYLYLANVELD